MLFNYFYNQRGFIALFKLLLVTSLFCSSESARAQLFKQDFTSPFTTSSGAILASGIYCGTPPTNTQFNSIGSSGPGAIFEFPSATNQLNFTRTADRVAFARSTDFAPIPTTLMYRFDLSVSGNSVASTNGAQFQIGFGFSPTSLNLETDVNTHSRIGINWTANAGEFSIRNSNNSASSVNFAGTQTVTWVVNNSDVALTYMGPDGIVQSLANDRDDVWIGKTLVFNEMAAVTAVRWLRNLKFTFLSGAATISFDNFLVDPIPIVTSGPAQTFCGGNNPTVANLVGNGINLKWYSALSGGTELTQTTALATGTYFVSQSPNGFESLRTPVSVGVIAAITNNTIGNAQTICIGSTPVALTGGIPIGGTGTYTYLWEVAPSSSGPFTTTLIETANFSPPALAGNQWYRRQVFSGICSSASLPVGITIQPLATVSAGAAIAAVAQGGTSMTLGGSFSGSATGAVWSATSGTFSNNAGSTPGTATFTASATSPASVTLTIRSTGGVCPVVSGSKIISVTPVNNQSLTGVVNRYAVVIGPDIIPVGSINCTLAAGESSQFARGDRAIIIQMKGASVSLPTSPTDITYGYISDMGNSGSHEFLYIDSVKGDRIRFRKSLLKAYNTSGLVQLIRIPQYTGNFTVRNSTSVSAIKLIRKGMGYTPNTTITTGFTITPTSGGSGLQIRALTDNLGQISEVQVLSAGTGYNRAPTITMPNPTVAPFNLESYKAKAVAITGLTGMQWNGKKGGLLVFEINGNLILQDSIKMSGMGFAGGMIGDKGSLTATCGVSTAYGLNWTNISRAGQKGEGIAVIPENVQRGRGRYATGGGGGMEPEGGGGGGANWQDGGRGGSSSYVIFANSRCSTSVTGCDQWITRGGLGGGTNPTIPVGFRNALRANSYFHTPIAFTRIFLGGGGGGGHALNNVTGLQDGGAGGYGGGIVIIQANDLKSNNFRILANGEKGENTSTGDGAGGGGAGGAILLKINNYSDVLVGRVNAGNGGDANSIICDAGFGSYTDRLRFFGAGGGGGGGVLWLSQSDLEVTPLAEGSNLRQSNQGSNNDPTNNSAQKGGTARSQSLLLFVENSPIVNAVLTVGSGITNPSFPSLKVASEWISMVGTTEKDVTILMGRNNIPTGAESNQILFNSGSSTSGSALKNITIKPYFPGASVINQNEAGKEGSIIINGLESLTLEDVKLNDSKDGLRNRIIVQNGSKLILSSVEGKSNIMASKNGENEILIQSLKLNGSLDIGENQKLSIQKSLTLQGSGSENASIILKSKSNFLLKDNALLNLDGAHWINNGASALSFGSNSKLQLSGTAVQQKIGGSSATNFENVYVSSTGNILIEKDIQAKSWVQTSNAVVNHGQNMIAITEKIQTGSGKFVGTKEGKVSISGGQKPVEIAGQFYSLEMNAPQNANAVGNIQVDHRLILNEGRIDLNNHDISIKSTESAAVSASANSWINGKMKRNVLAGQFYQFPVGSSNTQEIAAVQIHKTENGLSEIEAFYQEDAKISKLNKTDGFEKVQNQGKWAIKPNQGSAQFDLSLLPSQVYFPGEGKVLGKSSAQSTWSLVHSNSKSTKSQSDGSVNQTGVQTFGEFSIGRKTEITHSGEKFSNLNTTKPTLCMIENEGKKFEIQGGDQDVSSLRIIANDGKTFNQTVSSSSRIIDLTNRPTGVYLVEMIGENGEKTRQRIVLRD